MAAVRGTRVWPRFRGCTAVARALARAGDRLRPRPLSIPNRTRARSRFRPRRRAPPGFGERAHVRVCTRGVLRGISGGDRAPCLPAGLRLLRLPREAGQTCAKTLPVPSLSCVRSPSFPPLPEPTPLCPARGPLCCLPGHWAARGRVQRGLLPHTALPRPHWGSP